MIFFCILSVLPSMRLSLILMSLTLTPMTPNCLNRKMKTTLTTTQLSTPANAGPREAMAIKKASGVK